MISGNSSSILCRTRAARKAKPFEQPFDVRVLALVGVEQEPAGDLRVLRGELGSHLAEEGQLAVVVGQEVVVHGGRSSVRVRGQGAAAAGSTADGESADFERERLRGQLEDRVERDRLGHGLDVEHGVDPEPEAAVELTSLGHGHHDLVQPGLEPPDCRRRYSAEGHAGLRPGPGSRA